MSRQTRRIQEEPESGGSDAVALESLPVEEEPDGAARGRGRSDGAARGAPGRMTPARFGREIRNEMRQVAWPTRIELANYATVVLTVLVIMIALIFVLNFGFGKLVIYLFQK